MPTNTYTPIASVTLSATASEIVFSGLPQTFRDLIIVSDSISSASQQARLRVNGSTASIYSTVFMRGTPTAGSSAFTDTLAYLTLSNYSSGTTASVITQIMDYAQTNKHKTMLIRSGYLQPDDATRYVEASAVRWASNDAVTSVTVYPSTSTFAIGSTFTVFGVIA
jgi:hypothetical protein